MNSCIPYGPMDPMAPITFPKDHLIFWDYQNPGQRDVRSMFTGIYSSGNETWQWRILDLQMTFPSYKPPFLEDFVDENPMRIPNFY